MHKNVERRKMHEQKRGGGTFFLQIRSLVPCMCKIMQSGGRYTMETHYRV
jgi:hypothetical protein